MNENIMQSIIDYGRFLVATVAGSELQSEPAWVKPFLTLLQPDLPATGSNEPLQSIFTLVEIDGQRTEPAYLRPVALTLNTTAATSEVWALAPTDKATASAVNRRTVLQRFLANKDANEKDFNRFYHLMRKYASTLPNTYGEPGVSLFEQWKMIAALVCIAGSTDQAPTKLGLVGGDIPGIQRVINLVTAKGAAKAMRGRSAFIQLLGDALVQRLLDELGLGPANVVYDAGGNFVLLTGWSEDLSNRVAQVANEINTVLLSGTDRAGNRFDGFHGDLSVALAAEELPLAALCLPSSSDDANGTTSAWQQAEDRLKRAVVRAKQTPFADLALASEAGWKALFEPEPAQTDDFCAVCRRQRRSDEDFIPLDAESPEDSGVQCPECAGFKELAEALGHRSARLVVNSQRTGQVAGWQQALYAVSKRWYSIGDRNSRGEIVLTLDVDGFPAEGVSGFRLLARTTPLTEERTIKPNDVLAGTSIGGMKRLGVLRMDVDNLGALIVNGLPQRTPMATAELSQALERFFAGWLDRICSRVDGGDNLFYVLFAGGDDLFVIGPWTSMVPLAQAIYDDFTAYTGCHRAIHLSAGIAVVGAKAPLYAAADAADAALHEAKALDQKDPQAAKNAISFLDRTYHWQPFEDVDKLQAQLVELVNKRHLPSSLLTTLRAIESRYRSDRAEQRGAEGEQPARTRSGVVKVYFGPWMWRQAYALARMRSSQPDQQVNEELKGLENALLDGRIEDLGLAARWAQWETRKEPDDGNSHQ